MYLVCWTIESADLLTLAAKLLDLAICWEKDLADIWVCFISAIHVT